MNEVATKILCGFLHIALGSTEELRMLLYLALERKKIDPSLATGSLMTRDRILANLLAL